MGKAHERPSAPAPLSGARILVVEDDFLIALELAAVLSDAGADVVGPSQTIESALQFAERRDLSAAVLDIRIGTATVAPVAQRLATRGVPFIFYTGQSGTDPVREEWPSCRVLAKPASPLMLVGAVVALIESSGHSARPVAQ